MYSEVPFEQYSQDEDLIDQFAEYTTLDLRSNLLKLIQTNVVYSYCEALIVEKIDCTEEEIAQILDCCKDRNQNLLQAELPFEVLLKLKKAKDEVQQTERNREQIISLILNIIIENTLLYSSLARFAYN